MTAFKQETHNVDFCVVGGGMAGLCAAIAAARHGSKVVLMHDRPVFGGNASSECRVHICGADRHNHVKNMRETGILEEFRMENLYRNPNRNFSIWDSILYEKVLAEPSITPLLNCSCLNAEMDGYSLRTVTGWQLTTQTYHTVHARIFADCSGDAVLAPLTGAEFRIGRDARSEYGESIAPPEADARTMGMTCLFQSRKYDTAQQFIPPEWAHRYDTCDALPYGPRGHRWWQMGYWWIELGGEHDSIHDTETLRDELLRITYGVWDHIKNRCPNRTEVQNWALDWIQFLPAKRESRRYVGEYVLTQNDIESGGPFEDIVAYGGWSMDDHHPAGFEAVKIGAPATVFHHGPSPYGIPYRCLYSRNIVNLMFAGRDASCSHAAMSSTRVMGTGCSMGQAVGVAAAIAVTKGLSPAEIDNHVPELQQTLIHDDAYLPGHKQAFSELLTRATLTSSQGDPEPVRNGMNRPVGDDLNGWTCRPGDWIAYEFQATTDVKHVTVVLDSGLDQNVALSYHQKDNPLTSPPDVMPKAFRIEGLNGGKWDELIRVEQNHQRLCRFPIESSLNGVRVLLDETWGSETSRIYAFYLD
ncbi:MAG: FAD-dependent oxidoreductase [Phycisphaerae bacterium]|nr:FAD-dependent oxidoreductase [Phycisphaerae bacterium]